MINLTAFIQVVVKLGADDTTGSSLIRRMFLFASCTQLLHIDQLVTYSSNSYSGGFKEECLVEINSAWCTVTYLLW